MDIRLKSVKNIRDFSEYGCPDHIRSAHLNGLTPEEGKILTQRHHLKTVIDLRTTQEAEEKPDAVPPGVAYLHIPLFDGPVPGISHEQQTDKMLDMVPEMPRLYRELVTKDEHVRQIEKAMEVILDPEREGAVLWHCTEGKDRCGIISALFLLSHNVQPEAVLEDYLRTNRTNLTKAWKYYVLVLLAARNTAAASRVRDAFLAKREYLGPIMDRLAELAASFERK